MKHLLIASAAMLALTACNAASDDTASLEDLSNTIETETDLNKLMEAEAEVTKRLKSAADIKNKAAASIGSAFLAGNAKADGVITTASGLQYKVAQAGLETGAQAAPGQGIAAHYHGYFINEEVFDSSYKRGSPLRGPSNGFIEGWNEALGEMKVCEARTLYINSDLAYGDNGRGSIPGGATLLFNMQLLGVVPTDENTDAIYQCPDDKVLAGPEAYK